jgi:hypothetical protein
MSIHPTALRPCVTEIPGSPSTTNKCWDDFNHLERLNIVGSIIYERKTYDEHVFQYCKKGEWSRFRSMLTDRTCARWKNKLFLATNFVLSYRENVYVRSEVADMCLAYIIYSNIAMKEEHIAAILKPVRVSGPFFARLSNIE